MNNEYLDQAKKEFKNELKSETIARREQEISEREVNLLAKENGLTVEQVSSQRADIYGMSYQGKEEAIKNIALTSNGNLGKTIAEKYVSKPAKSSYFRY